MPEVPPAANEVRLRFQSRLWQAAAGCAYELAPWSKQAQGRLLIARSGGGALFSVEEAQVHVVRLQRQGQVECQASGGHVPVRARFVLIPNGFHHIAGHVQLPVLGGRDAEIAFHGSRSRFRSSTRIGSNG